MNICIFFLISAHSFTRGKSDVNLGVNLIDNSPKIRFLTHMAKTVSYYLQSVARRYAFGHKTTSLGVISFMNNPLNLFA